MTNQFSLNELEKIIHTNAQSSPEKSYTAQLFQAGTEKCAQKFGEEAIELIIASQKKDTGHIICEAADVLYHYLVLMHRCNVSLDDIMQQLAKRTGQSGLEEKRKR